LLLLIVPRVAVEPCLGAACLDSASSREQIIGVTLGELYAVLPFGFGSATLSRVFLKTHKTNVLRRLLASDTER
jgi:hypothetical protein